MAFNALRVANEIITRSAQAGRELTNLSLQKLVFFAHGWHLALLDDPLVDATFEAWRYGPVVPSLYHTFKYHSGNPIPANHWLSDTPAIPADSPSSAVLDQVLKVYGKYTGPQLVAISHDSNGPWHKIYHDPGPQTEISDTDIKAYFRSLLPSQSAGEGQTG